MQGEEQKEEQWEEAVEAQGKGVHQQEEQVATVIRVTGISVMHPMISMTGISTITASKNNSSTASTPTTMRSRQREQRHTQTRWVTTQAQWKVSDDDFM